MKQTILLIERNDLERDNLQFVLEMKGYEVITAKDSKAGLHKAFHLRPDLILNASSAPSEAEIDVLRQIRSNPRTANIRFMLISEGLPVPAQEVYSRLGGCAFLGKPFAMQELVDTVQWLLDSGRVKA